MDDMWAMLIREPSFFFTENDWEIGGGSGMVTSPAGGGAMVVGTDQNGIMWMRPTQRWWRLGRRGTVVAVVALGRTVVATVQRRGGENRGSIGGAWVWGSGRSSRGSQRMAEAIERRGSAAGVARHRGGERGERVGKRWRIGNM